MPEQRHTGRNRQHLHLHDARLRARRQGEVLQGPDLPIRDGLADGSRQFGAGQGRHGVDEQPAQRPVAGTGEHACERVVPQRDSPVAIEQRHALFQMVDHLATPMVILEPTHVVGIGAIGKEQRDRGHRRDVPHPAIDYFDERSGDTGSQHVNGESRQRAFRPRSIDGPSRDKRHDYVRQGALHDVIGDERGGDGHRQPRPHEDAGHTGHPLMGQARALCGRDDDGGVDEHLAARSARSNDARRQRRHCGDEHRHVRTEEHERTEDEDEGGGHDAPVARDRLPHPEAAGQHRRQNES